MTPSPNSFKKSMRLLKPGEFLNTCKKGRRIHTDSFIIYKVDNLLGRNRLGISVGSKVGNAVRRNRLKRLMREFFRLRYTDIEGSSDIHISVKKPTRKGKAAGRFKGAKGAKGEGSDSIKMLSDVERELMALTDPKKEKSRRLTKEASAPGI